MSRIIDYVARGIDTDYAGSTESPSSTCSRIYPGGNLTACSALFGLVYMLPILFTLGDLDTILASVTGQPVPEMFLQATGSQAAAFGLFFIGKYGHRDWSIETALADGQCWLMGWHVD